MKLIKDKINLSELQKMAKNMFGDMVKAVIDIDKKIMVVFAELHADQEKMLLDKGSEQKNLWGINLYPSYYGKKEFVEFDSMINIKPNQNNRSRDIQDPKVRKKIIDLINNLVKNDL